MKIYLVYHFELQENGQININLCDEIFVSKFPAIKKCMSMMDENSGILEFDLSASWGLSDIREEMRLQDLIGADKVGVKETEGVCCSSTTSEAVPSV